MVPTDRRARPIGWADMKAPQPLVVKFGGSIVGSGGRIARAAQMVRTGSARLTFVVASAPGDLTDRTLDVLTGSALPTEGPDAARVLARAEHLGAELMTAALRAQGAPARLLLPGEPDWPIILSGPGSNASVDLEATGAHFRRIKGQSPAGAVWVLPGFVGVDRFGLAGTLPRGGGDSTAVVAGRCLGASAVYLVKDVPAVFGSDPQADPTARPITELSRAAMEDLARAGARVVALDALQYLVPGIALRVVGLGAPLDGSSGSVIRAPPEEGPRGIRPPPDAPPALVRPAPVR
jgi:aspartate kinase